TLQALLGRADSAAGEAGDVVKLLGETGGAPPNMALRARIRAERARMDAVVAQCKADVAARHPDKWAETGGSRKGPADSSGPQRTPAGIHERTPPATGQDSAKLPLYPAADFPHLCCGA